jgi:hypothetical protein
MLFMGACKRFAEAWSKDRARTRERKRLVQAVKDCHLCNETGYLELKEQGTGRLIAHPCPHRLEQVVQIEEKLRSFRS